MRTRALVVTALCVLGSSLGCGSDHSPSPPPDGGGTAGGGGTGGGGGGGGGSGGGGSGGGGGGSGGGSAGPVTSADGSVTIDRLDADPECDPLVPSSAPDALTMRVVSDTPSCGPGAADGAGNVVVAGRVGQGFVRWQVFTASGGPEGTFPTFWNGQLPLGLVLLPGGFQGLQVTSLGTSSAQVDVQTFAGDGSLAHTERGTPPSSERPTFGWIHAADPLGGSALVHFGVPRGGGACSGIVSRYDATGALRSTGSYGSGGDCRAAGAAVSSRGETLVAESFQNTLVLWWVGPGGQLARPPATAGSVPSVFSTGRALFLAPLLDGSIVASEGGTWTRRFPYLGDHAEDAPGWLASRPGFTFRNTRGAKGYALLPPQDQQSGDCAQAIELLAPSGRLCGKVTLKGDGGSCRTATVDQGWDGTVVQQAPRDRCAWRTWPRLLAGG